MSSIQSVGITEVLSRSDESQFLRVPFDIYADDTDWVPPLMLDEKRRWDIKHNSSLIERSHWRFLAWRGNRPVGRIAASLDPSFAQRWYPESGFFGFFECIDDDEVASALLEVAEKRLAKEGVRTVIGPVNLSTQDEVGLLTEGFGDPPRILTPYNPPYYSKLIYERGFRPLRQYHSYLWQPNSQPFVNVERLVTSLQKRATSMGLVVRAPVRADWHRELRRLHELYNLAFENVWGFSPIIWPEFEERANRFRPFLNTDLVVLVELHGHLVGFGLALPDINMVLKKMGGRLFPFGWLIAMWSASRIDRARFLLLGVHPDQSGSGLGALIASEMAKRGKKAGVRDAELSLVDTDNSSINRIILASGCKPVKTFTLYSKNIG